MLQTASYEGENNPHYSMQNKISAIKAATGCALSICKLRAISRTSKEIGALVGGDVCSRVSSGLREWIHSLEVLQSSTNLVSDWNELLTVGPSFYVSFTFTKDYSERYDDPVEQNEVCLCWLPRYSFKGLG